MRSVEGAAQPPPAGRLFSFGSVCSYPASSRAELGCGSSRGEVFTTVVTRNRVFAGDDLVALAVSLCGLAVLKPLVFLEAMIAVISLPRFALEVSEHLSTAVVALVELELASAPAVRLKPVFNPSLEGDGSTFRRIGLVGEGAEQIGEERLLLLEVNVFEADAWRRGPMDVIVRGEGHWL